MNVALHVSLALTNDQALQLTRPSDISLQAYEGTPLPPQEVLSIEDEIAYLERTLTELPSVDRFVRICQKCRQTKSLSAAQQMHIHACFHGLDVHSVLGNHIVPMFVDCGSMPDGQQVFGRVIDRNTYAWTSLINGYVEIGKSEDALELYFGMQEDVVSPNQYTFVALSKACSRLDCVKRGRILHADIVIQGFETDQLVENSLIDMYAKLGLFPEARDILINMQIQDVFSWTALIGGYAEHGLGNEALSCLDDMKLEGISPNNVTFLCSLKACGRTGTLDKGRELHVEIIKEGYEADLAVGQALIDMYGKFESLVEAWDVFNELQSSDANLWNAAIIAFAENGSAADSLILFQKMQQVGISPVVTTYGSILKVHGRVEDIDNVQEVYAELAKKGLEREAVVGETLVESYVQCRSVSEAYKVSRMLLERNTGLWIKLIVACAEKGYAKETLIFFEEMQMDGFSPDAVAFVSCLKACSSLGDTEEGRRIHTGIINLGLEGNRYIGNSLVDFYAKSFSVVEARHVLENLPVTDVIAWTALMAGYVQEGYFQEALDCVEQMQLDGLSPDSFTLLCALRACSSLEDVTNGNAIYMEAVKKGFEKNLVLGNAVIDLYAKCGSLVDAQDVFDNLAVQDVVSWTALIAGYAEQGLGEAAIGCFEQMQEKGVPPDSVTYICCLKGCGTVGALERGRELHDQITQDSLEQDYVVGSALMDFYAKCNSPVEARDVFNELQFWDVVAWTVLISGYVESGCTEEALTCFQEMQLEGVVPNEISWNSVILGYADQGEIEEVFKLYGQMQEHSILPNSATFTSILTTFATTAGQRFGKRIHAQMCGVSGLETTDVIVGTALVDMYGKCGSVEDAQHAFDAMVTRTSLTWNALITAYARQGECKLIFDMLDKMKEEGVKADGVTFLTIMTICSHAGLVETGQQYFEAMSKEHNISPTLRHYVCMVDLLARAGQLKKAVEMVENMPFAPDVVLWHSILGACRKWGNVKLGRHAFDNAVKLDEYHSSSYITMANTYADAQMWEEVQKIEAMRASMQARRDQDVVLKSVPVKSSTQIDLILLDQMCCRGDC